MKMACFLGQLLFYAAIVAAAVTLAVMLWPAFVAIAEIFHRIG